MLLGQGMGLFRLLYLLAAIILTRGSNRTLCSTICVSRASLLILWCS